jgi:hypothetical protein
MSARSGGDRMTRTLPPDADLHDVVMAVLATSPRYARDGRLVSTRVWNERVASRVAEAYSILHGQQQQRAAQDNPGTTALAACCTALGVDPAVMVTDCRTNRVTRARQITAWVLRSQYAQSYPEIGRILGRDHSTVMHAVHRVQEALDDGDPWWRTQVDTCLAALGRDRLPDPADQVAA